MAVALGGFASACAGASDTGQAGSQGDSPAAREEAARQGRLTARPRARVRRATRRGLYQLAPELEHGALLYVPRRCRPGRTYRLVLTLHGAGGGGRNGLAPFLPLADRYGLILLAPHSRGPTWDVILGGYGPDVAFIDRMLAEAFSRCAIHRGRVAIAGFSDGASYALSLGLTNGDLFSSVIAFSPGFSAPAGRQGSPRIFVSHGTQDRVLPVGKTSRRIVRELRRGRYSVRYREFGGPHTVPPSVAREAVRWLGAR